MFVTDDDDDDDDDDADDDDDIINSYNKFKVQLLRRLLLLKNHFCWLASGVLQRRQDDQTMPDQKLLPRLAENLRSYSPAPSPSTDPIGRVARRSRLLLQGESWEVRTK